MAITNEQIIKLSDALADNHEAFAASGMTADDMVSLGATLGYNRDAYIDALELLCRPPRYPLWRYLIDILLMAVLALCIITVYANPLPWQYQSTTIALCSVLMYWLDSMSRCWERRRAIR